MGVLEAALQFFSGSFQGEDEGVQRSGRGVWLVHEAFDGRAVAVAVIFGKGVKGGVEKGDRR